MLHRFPLYSSCCFLGQTPDLDILRTPSSALSIKLLMSTCCVLQGSQDAEAWSTLKVHSNDHTLKMAGQYASWPVTGHAACMSFRFFRLYQSCSSASYLNQSSRQLALTYFELYGHFGIESGFSGA